MDTGQILFQTSLIAAYIAGMVALFAPCCITFLLPAYLGGVFKEKEKVLLMTLIFGMGIFVVLLPAVIGVSLITKFTFKYHDTIYYAGGIVMLIAALNTFLGIKLPMPTMPNTAYKEKPDVASVFTLGIFSGITSACCAPVLVGIMGMALLSPSILGVFAIGVMYVLGMVTPLLLISLFLNNKVPNVSWLRKSLLHFEFLGKRFNVIVSNLIAATVFGVTGILTLLLTYNGSLTNEMDGFSEFIGSVSTQVATFVGDNIFLNGLFLIAIIYFIYRLVKNA
jgi:cytochrome c-type biogenesis protein